MRGHAAFWVFALIGCGSGVGEVRAPEPSPDPALELARALPAGADRCAVTRPAAVSRVRRGLVRPLSQAGPAAWLPRAPVVAHAWVERSGPDGRRASVTLLRVHGDRDAVRKRLEADLRVRLSWDEGACRGASCPALRASFLDARTVRIEQGAWPTEAPPGAAERCATLAAEHSDALEVTSRRGELVVESLEDLVPRRLESVLHRRSEGFELVRRRWMTTPEWAERARRLELSADEAPGVAGLATERWSERRGRLVVSTYRFDFEDLFLAFEDARRLRRARRAAAGRAFVVPIDRVNVANLEEVRRQVSLRFAALDRAGPAGRRELAETLARLLERAIAAHPEARDLHRRLARLALDELDEPREAEAVADAVLSRGEGELEKWRLLRREARAARSAERLAEALHEDGRVASAERARRAAQDLVALHRRGVDYAWAEGAMEVAVALERSPSLDVHPVEPPVRLPLASLLPTLVTLVDLGFDTTDPVYFAVQSASWVEPLGDDPACLPFQRTGAEGWCVGGVDEGVDARAIEGGRRMASRLGQGAFSIVMASVSTDGRRPQPRRVLQVEGRVEDDAFVLTGASGAMRSAPWDRTRRYLAEPLAGLAPRMFPAPEIRIEAERSAHARRILRHAADLPGVQCRARQRSVRCRLEGLESIGGAARALV
ncbi:MAG: hypothetical protein ACOCXM_07650, partial [Myxococcota bacterium]